jgi:2-oxoisovalerate dehydrogenase E2 component (dihydrolipoyl transacylase)
MLSSRLGLRGHFLFRQVIPCRRFDSTKSIPFKLADIGEGITEVELLQWFVKEGDAIKSFDRICEVQSDKATVEITSRYDGVISKVHHKVGDIMRVGEAIVDINKENTEKPKLSNFSETDLRVPQAAMIPNTPVGNSISFSNHGSGILTTPAVRKLAREHSLDLKSISPTGPKGRITKEDILLAIPNSPLLPKLERRFPEFTVDREKNILSEPEVPEKLQGTVPIKGIQRMMFKSMTLSKDIPHLTLGDEVVMDNLVKAKKSLEPWAKSSGIKITYLPFFIKAISLGLLQYPIMNSSISPDGLSWIYHDEHNIGVAMDTSRGLVVPVVKSVQKKSIKMIISELQLLQSAAKDSKLTELQLSGATFSLSNIGSIAGTYAIPGNCKL